MVLDETPLEPRFVVWRCDHCRNGIEFDVVQLAGRKSCRVPCPHCGQETSLQEPPPPPRLIPDEGWTLPVEKGRVAAAEPEKLVATAPEPVPPPIPPPPSLEFSRPIPEISPVAAPVVGEPATLPPAIATTANEAFVEPAKPFPEAVLPSAETELAKVAPPSPVLPVAPPAPLGISKAVPEIPPVTPPVVEEPTTLPPAVLPPTQEVSIEAAKSFPEAALLSAAADPEKVTPPEKIVPSPPVFVSEVVSEKVAVDRQAPVVAPPEKVLVAASRPVQEPSPAVPASPSLPALDTEPIPQIAAPKPVPLEPKPIMVTLPPDPPAPGQMRGPVDVRWLTDLGVVYFRQHQFGEAFLCFSRAARQGFATAEFCLAVCHFNGHGTPPDAAAALPWLQKAAAQGDANAEFTLGLAYRLGRGVAPDELLAKQWLQKAAAHGHSEARLRLREIRPEQSAQKPAIQNKSLPAPAVPVPENNPAKPGHELQRLILGLFRKK